MAASNPTAHCPSAIRKRKNMRSALAQFLTAPHPQERLFARTKARSTDHFQPCCRAVVWAVASTQVAVESRKRLLVPLAHPHALAVGPIDEVFGRSKVSASCTGGVARLR